MRLSYHDMEMDISLEGLIEIEYFTWKEAVNIHGKVQIQFLADEDVILEILLQSAQKTEIIIMEKNEEGISQKTFCGKASRIWSKKDKGLFYLWAEFVSYTKEWDLTPKSQSFCRLSQSYTEVLYEVLYEYPQKDIRDEITQGQAIKDKIGRAHV